MEFVLTYEGPLNATQRDPVGNQPPKHLLNRRALREAFNRQLKELWKITPHLGNGFGQLVVEFEKIDGEPENPPVARMVSELAQKHQHYGYNFVPLVTSELDLLCSIEILFLRADRPGSVVWAGDIDNRLKTLLDALRVPEASENYAADNAEEKRHPFFVLLEDDKLITRVSVETDRLLAPVNGDYADVRLIIHVKIKPYTPSLWNAHFG